MLERTISKKVISCSEDFKVLLLTGPRQVGKTTLLKSLIEEERSYVTLDNLQALTLANEDVEAFFSIYPLPLMIDEVQRAPNIFLKIKELVDSSNKKNQIWLTGSQKPRLMKNVSDTLVGRVVEIGMYPLSQAEKQEEPYRASFYPLFDGEVAASWSYKETLENVIMGGYPDIQFIKRENRNAWFHSYISTYILGDIRQEEDMDEALFLKLLRVLATRTGETLNYSSIAGDVGISAYRIEKIVNLLISYGIIHLIPPYSNNALKALVKTPRLYFSDTGLCCYLLDIFDVDKFLSHSLSGHIFETYVVNELIKNARNNGDDAVFSFYREEGKRKKDEDKTVREIDIIKESGGRLYPIEIKMNATPTSAMARHFVALEGSEMGTIICLSAKKTILRKDLLVLPVSLI